MRAAAIASGEAAPLPARVPEVKVDVDNVSHMSVVSESDDGAGAAAAVASTLAPTPSSHRSPHMSAHDIGLRVRLLNRMENAFHRFKLHAPMDPWEHLPLDDLQREVVKAESVAEILELEHLRRVGHPATKPYFDEKPTMDTDAAVVATLDAKVRALSTLYRLVENPKIARLRLQAYALSVDDDLGLLEAAAVKAQLLRDVKSHLKYIKLVGTEEQLDLSSPLEAVQKLHDATAADHRLLKSFAKCPMCKMRHAPQYVLDKHPHLKLKPTGLTSRGSKICCVTCAPYWD